MTDLANKPPRTAKPSGPITYTVVSGADVFPGAWLNDEGFVRVLDGQLAIFQAAKGRGEVTVTVGGRNRVLRRDEWRALPVYQG
jgi:hypothetical protein